MTNRKPDGWNTKSDYEVGYKKPPKQFQFSKGKSGNPKGRPKRRKGNRELLEEVLNTQVLVTENGTSKKIAYTKLLYKSLATSAIKGNTRSAALLLKTMDNYGMLEDTGPTLQKIIVNFVDADGKKKQLR